MFVMIHVPQVGLTYIINTTLHGINNLCFNCVGIFLSLIYTNNLKFAKYAALEKNCDTIS